MQFVNSTKSNVERNAKTKKRKLCNKASEARMEFALNYCFDRFDELINVKCYEPMEIFVVKVYNGDFSSPQFK